MRLWRSATFRLSAALIFFSLVSASVLLGGAYLVIGARLRTEVRAATRAEIAGLAALEARDGWSALVREIEAAGPGAEDDPFVYRLEPVVGSAVGAELALGEPGPAGWRDALPPWGEEDEPYVAREHVFDEGRLIVAAEAERLNDALEFLAEEAPLGLALVLPVSLPGAIFVAAFALRRIDQIARTVKRVEGGALTERVPVRGFGDEYDRLAEAVNAMLDSLADLNEGLRQVSADIAHDLRSPLSRLRTHLQDLTRIIHQKRHSGWHR